MEGQTPRGIFIRYGALGLAHLMRNNWRIGNIQLGQLRVLQGPEPDREPGPGPGNAHASRARAGPGLDLS